MRRIRSEINIHLQFKVGNYQDDSWKGNIRMLTGTIKADELYLAALPTLKQGVIAGVFRQKGAADWGITRAEKLELLVFLPTTCLWRIGVQGSPSALSIKILFSLQLHWCPCVIMAHFFHEVDINAQRLVVEALGQRNF